MIESIAKASPSQPSSIAALQSILPTIKGKNVWCCYKNGS